MKYPQSEGYKYVWIFDHSSCHSAKADDSLDVSKINVNPEGKATCIWWEMDFMMKSFSAWTIFLILKKGLRVALEGRGVNERKAYCNYSIHFLRKILLNSVPLQSIQKHFQKVCHYMFTYLEGIPRGTYLEKLVKKHKKTTKIWQEDIRKAASDLSLVLGCYYHQHFLIISCNYSTFDLVVPFSI